MSLVNDNLQIHNLVMLCVYVCVALVETEERWIIVRGGWLRTGEKNYKKSSQGLNKEVESLVSTQRSRDARWRLLRCSRSTASGPIVYTPGGGDY